MCAVTHNYHLAQGVYVLGKFNDYRLGVIINVYLLCAITYIIYNKRLWKTLLYDKTEITVQVGCDTGSFARLDKNLGANKWLGRNGIGNVTGKNRLSIGGYRCNQQYNMCQNKLFHKYSILLRSGVFGPRPVLKIKPVYELKY